MGSLTSLLGGRSRAKGAVYVPPVRAVERPVATPAATPVPDADVAAAAQAENLLRRNRGRLSTITTDERGVLAAVQAPTLQRKTLLGE